MAHGYHIEWLQILLKFGSFSPLQWAICITVTHLSEEKGEKNPTL